jgi:predicted dehydrogenase
MDEHGEHWVGQMSRKLRGAVFGCGMISEHHLRAWNRIPEVEIVALGNRTAERAERRRREFAPAARVYDDLRLMLGREDLDFVDILTAPSVHRDHCLTAKQAGVHIICQKPLCNTLSEAKELACEMSGYGRLFAIHENHRYRPWFQRIDSQYRSGGFGKVSLVRLEHLNAREPAEAYKLAAAEGVLLEYGSHLVDMMRGLLGEPLRVYARAHHLNPAVKAESLVHAVYEYSHTTAVIDVAWKHAAITQGSVLVAGSVGEAYFEGTMTRGDTSRFRLWRNGSIICDEHRSVMEDYADSFYYFERQCVDAMLGGPGTAARTVEDYLPTLVCTFAAYESVNRGAIVEIPREVN